ncbi:hypothetical protein L2W58_00240 [Dethiosulfovibrio sp. F2B]|uniref:hypothetical protein n=1 Tax=Dethiosulfovibrio faecalis TaxID=2720018 RepID=UPI001F233453|nr:hypothetical protein [Dethiosulfovibrio faecalis]MCF4150237.1 hypothetical protein [Dethiosulfovibrio faecalis]
MRENVEKIKEALSTLVADAKYLKERMNELSEWNSLKKVRENLSNVVDFVGRIVVFAELATSQVKDEISGLQSKDKRDAVVEYLDGLIVLPWFLEPFDGPIIRGLVDYAVDKLNERLGHDWGLDRIEELATHGRDILDIAGPLPWEARGTK